MGRHAIQHGTPRGSLRVHEQRWPRSRLRAARILLRRARMMPSLSRSTVRGGP